MKCQYCGVNLAIEDEKCPFCGEPNPFMIKHRSEMKQFTKEFEKTRTEVIEKSNRFNSWTIRVTVIAVLVALNVTVLLMFSRAWDIQKLLRAREINKNFMKHKATMEQQEEDREYIALAEYYDTYYLRSNKAFEHYEKVYYACQNYEYFCTYLLDVVVADENEYNRKEDQIAYMVDQIEYVYKYSQKQEYVDEKYYTPEHVACMQDLVKQMEDILQEYCNLTDEEVEKFPEMSKARRQIAIERGLGLDD